jgi:hypothetical protein
MGKKATQKRHSTNESIIETITKSVNSGIKKVSFLLFSANTSLITQFLEYAYKPEDEPSTSNAVLLKTDY